MEEQLKSSPGGELVGYGKKEGVGGNRPSGQEYRVLSWRRDNATTIRHYNSLALKNVGCYGRRLLPSWPDVPGSRHTCKVRLQLGGAFVALTGW